MSLIDANRRSTGLMLCSAAAAAAAAAADDDDDDVRSRCLTSFDVLTSLKSTLTSSELVVVSDVLMHISDASRSHITRLICVVYTQRHDHRDVT